MMITIGDCNGDNDDYNEDCNGDIDECKLPLKHSFSQWLNIDLSVWVLTARKVLQMTVPDSQFVLNNWAVDSDWCSEATESM